MILTGPVVDPTESVRAVVLCSGSSVVVTLPIEESICMERQLTCVQY